MKKNMLFLLLLIMLVPFMAKAEENYTITFDANDGSGRTKVVEVDNINKVEMPGVDIFKNLNDNPEDPLDDKIIYGWNMKTGQDIYNYSKTRFHFNHIYDLEKYYEDSNNITIYAEWQGRMEITPLDKDVYGDSVKYENDYVIEPKTDFTIEFNDFRRNAGYQLLYYKLPDYFANVLSDSLKKKLEEPIVLTEKINDGGDHYTYYGKVYIKNDYLIINFINDGSEAYAKMDAIIAVSFNIKYSFKYKKVTYNDRLLAVATVSGELNNQPTGQSNDIYPTGKIKTHYIDIDTNEEIKDSIEEEEIIGTKYSKKFVEIKDYTFVENTNDDIEFEEEQQTVYYKYRKIKSNKPMILENPKTGNKSLIIIITTTIVLSTITLIYKKKRI
ncbi:MAG: MucBP domain-containing protein [Bacilli bacterium]|nr:MucBP domain-containing protein [Bacilli bacterium]